MRPQLAELVKKLQALPRDPPDNYRVGQISMRGQAILKIGDEWQGGSSVQLPKKEVERIVASVNALPVLLREIEKAKIIPQIVEAMQEIAKRHGWSAGVHGSLRRDIDLIVVPWVADAAPWHHIYDEWLETLPLQDTEGDYRYREPQRPFGRKSLLILQRDSNRITPGHPKGAWDPPCLDVSFMIPPEHLADKNQWTIPAKEPNDQ